MTFNISDPSIEMSLKKIASELEIMNATLKSLISSDDSTEVPTEQLTSLTQEANVAKATSDALSQAIEHNQ